MSSTCFRIGIVLVHLIALLAAHVAHWSAPRAERPGARMHENVRDERAALPDGGFRHLRMGPSRSAGAAVAETEHIADLLDLWYRLEALDRS